MSLVHIQPIRLVNRDDGQYEALGETIINTDYIIRAFPYYTKTFPSAKTYVIVDGYSDINPVQKCAHHYFLAEEFEDFAARTGVKLTSDAEVSDAPVRRYTKRPRQSGAAPAEPT